MQQPGPAPDAVERALATVYSRPEFAPQEPPLLIRWLRDILTSVREWFASLFPGLDPLSSGGSVLATIILGMLVLAAGAILLHLGFAIAGFWRGRSRKPRPDLPASAPVAAALRSAEFWEEEAHRAAAEGRFREAATALYHVVLLRLDGRGLLRYDPAKTPGEYRREVAAQHEAADLDRFLRLWEPLVFGGRSPGADSYQQVSAAAEFAGG